MKKLQSIALAASALCAVTLASQAGPLDQPYGLELLNERGLSYIMTAPGDLGLARAYVAGDLVLHGVHPGDPYEAINPAPWLQDHGLNL